MSKHTPGPWVVGRDLVGHVSREDDQSYGMIMPVAYIERYDFPDSHEANARLIAAAPELLESLEYMLETCPGIDHVGDEARKQAFEAVKKARGEQ